MAHEAAELVKALAWPIAVLLSLTMLRHPISDFLRDISKRVTKLSIFKVEIELAKLNAIRALPGPLLMPLQKGVFRPDAPTVDANANILNMETMPIVTTGIIRVSMADYVIIDVGEGDEWLTSRLYLLAALLERSLVRAIVFTTKGDFVGMANPHDVRSMLGIAFTEYERAFLRACGDAGDLPMSEFRHSGWSEPVISMIIGGLSDMTTLPWPHHLP